MDFKRLAAVLEIVVKALVLIRSIEKRNDSIGGPLALLWLDGDFKE